MKADNVASVRLVPQLRIHVNSSTGCWEWVGARNDDGYGQVHWEGRTQPAHRAVFSLLVGTIDEGMTLDHLCRNRPCVNPAHMEVTTSAENTARMLAVRYGRRPSPAEVVEQAKGAAQAVRTADRQLLSDLLTVFDALDEPRAWSDTLVRDLAELRPDTYGDWTPDSLAKALPTGLNTRQINARDAAGQARNRKGLYLDDIRSAHKGTSRKSRR